MTPGLVGLLCLGLLIASVMRGKGNLHKLHEVVDTTINPPEPDLTPVVVGPGGQDAIKLTRSAISIGKDVEFLSTTLLPGRGMNVFQITAMVPGHGEVPLLLAPDVDTVAQALTDKDEDTNGETSMRMGGAFQLPWAGRLTGSPTNTPGELGAVWNGSPITFPAYAAGSQSSGDGLFLDAKADEVKSDVLPDGQYAQATFHEKNFGGHWPSTVDVTVTVEMGAHTLDLTVSATNTGKENVPFGIGWHPIFVVPSGNRQDTTLEIPSSTMLDANHRTGIPSGKTIGAGGTPMDFDRPKGVRLGTQDLDAIYTNLQAGTQSSHPVVEMRDPAYNLSVKIIPLSANITNLHVVAPSDKKWISITPATNVPDPQGAEWHSQNTGAVTLAPGETVQWKVRIEIAPIVTGDDR
jgi:aldose 1-epimerase